MSINPRRWRAPMWSPVWLRRLFPGVWTAEEIADINRRAREQWVELQKYIH